MALKRKFEVEEEDTAPRHARPVKQLRGTSLPFPAVQSQDVAMFDASLSPANSSSASAPSHDASQQSHYPAFNLYPFPSYSPGDVEMDVGFDNPASSSADSRTSSNASEVTPSVGLLQPKSSFAHNFSNCTQIPRLRVACESGVGGSRSLWTQCDECGAIEMIDA